MTVTAHYRGHQVFYSYALDAWCYDDGVPIATTADQRDAEVKARGFYTPCQTAEWLRARAEAGDVHPAGESGETVNKAGDDQ